MEELKLTGIEGVPILKMKRKADFGDKKSKHLMHGKIWLNPIGPY